MAGQPDPIDPAEEHPSRLLCWLFSDGGFHCDRMNEHEGKHSWEIEPPAPTPDYLTDEEHTLVTDIGRLAERFSTVTGNGSSRGGDLSEITAHIHGLQNMVLAQAAARAYPDRYRRLGTSFDGSE